MSKDKRFIKWYLTKRCDLGCVFCHNSDQRKSWETDISSDSMAKIATKLAKSEMIEGLTLLGGEPTIASGFFDVAKAFVGAKFKFGIVTAGHHLSEDKYEELITNPNLKFLGVSVDSLDPDEVKLLRGINTLPNQISGIKRADQLRSQLGLSFEIYVNIVLSTMNGQKMPEIVQELKSIGVNQVKILGFNKRGRGKESGVNLRPTVLQELEYVHMLASQYKEMKENWRKDNFKVEYCFLSSMGKDYVQSVYEIEDFPLSGHLCPISRSVAYIVNDGDLYPCEEFRPYFGLDESRNTFKPISLMECDVDESLSSDYIVDTFQMVGNPGLYETYEPCNECRHLFVNCVPCGVRGTDKSNTIKHDRCSIYKELLVEVGKYQPREGELKPLTSPLIKHHVPSV